MQNKVATPGEIKPLSHWLWIQF